MMRLCLIGIILFMMAGQSQAQSVASPGLAALFYPRVSATFQGPADVLGAASAFYSCSEAMSTAYAASLGQGCVVCLPSDTTCETLSFNSAGKIVPGVTTSTCTKAGGGIICTIKEYFDQSGNGHHEIQTTIASRDTFVPSTSANGCPSSSWACATASGAATYQAVITNVGLPFSYSMLAQCSGASGNGGVIGNFSSEPSFLFRQGSPCQIALNQGAGGSGIIDHVAQSNATAHSFQGISASGTSASAVVVDNTATSGTLSGTTGTDLSLSAFTGANYTGLSVYRGMWAKAFSSTEYGNQHTQDSGRFGTP